VRVLIQRVSSASVEVAGTRVAEIANGLLVFVGFFPEDAESQIEWVVDKTLELRIFPGANNLMNVCVMDVAGGVLIVPQFTLAADITRGKRPGFSSAAPPEQAKALYAQFVAAARARYPNVSTGEFGADMQVALVNDGPVTFLLER